MSDKNNVTDKNKDSDKMSDSNASAEAIKSARRIAPLPLRARKVEMTEEVKNEEKKKNEVAFLKEQLRRTYRTMQDHNEKQKAQEAAINKFEEEIKVLKENNKGLGDTILEILEQTKLYEQALEHKEKLIAEKTAHIQELYEATEKLSEVYKMAEEKAIAEVREKEAEIADLKKTNADLEAAKNNAVAMAAEQPTTEIQELKNTIRALERRNESLNADFDVERSRLEAAEKKCSEVTVLHRQALTNVANQEANIKAIERLLEEREAAIAKLEHDAASKDNRLRGNLDDLKNKTAEVNTLSNLNKQLRQENTRLRAQTANLEIQLQDRNADIEILQVASQDYDKLQTGYAEVQAAADRLRTEIETLENQNSDLKAKVEEQTLFPPRNLTSSASLEDELSQSDYHSVAGDASSSAGFDGSAWVAGSHFRSRRGAAPPGGFFASEHARIAHAAGDAEDTVSSAEIVTPQVVVTPTQDTQSGTAQQSGTTSQVITALQSGTGPLFTVFASGTPQAGLVGPLQFVVLKSHNPLECWLQVYIDLWILLVIYFKKQFQGLFGNLDTASVTDGAAVRGLGSDLGGSSSSDDHAEGEHAAVATLTASSMDHQDLDKEVPDVLNTVSALCFHILFYAFIMLCVANYRALLSERSIWLSANEITRNYFHKFYRLPFRREYGVLYELFGPFRPIDIWRYKVYNWVQVSRSLPG